MMKKELGRNVKALCLILAMCIIGTFITGCGGNAPVKAADLLGNLKKNTINADEELSKSGTAAITDFAVRLFLECDPAGDNTLISPLSIIYALAMTANGAQEETLEQMEENFGLSFRN